jgi:predicted nucleic acid-binding protein
MSVFLLDTNIVSILFKQDHPLNAKCARLLLRQQLAISFMSRAELLLWPKVNQWGPRRAKLLQDHLELYTTLFPNGETCELWSRIIADCFSLGRPMATADAWIAASARQWNLPLVTTDYRDFESVEGLSLVPIE